MCNEHDASILTLNESTTWAPTLLIEHLLTVAACDAALRLSVFREATPGLSTSLAMSDEMQKLVASGVVGGWQRVWLRLRDVSGGDCHR